MPEQLSQSPYFISAIALLSLGILFSITCTIALFRARVSSFVVQNVLSLILLLAGGVAGLVAFGIQGYKTFTREEVAAIISVSPIAPQKFTALFRYPNGKTANFIISGDEIYIDAHILKWQPIANFFGLHTSYELDRIGGRYRDIEQERSAERSLHALGLEKPIDLFKLRQRHTFLAPLVDAKYGSATFIAVSQPAEFELRVSTTGLLLRELPPTIAAGKT